MCVLAKYAGWRMRLLLVPLLFDDEGLVTAETNQVQRERGTERALEPRSGLYCRGG